jgi:transposase-like protein
MPWLETDPMTERKRLILEWLGGDLTVAELCRRHDISRKTGYKWIDRYQSEGPDGLQDRSHQPHVCPHATPPHVLEEACRICLSRRTLVGAKKGSSPVSVRVSPRHDLAVEVESSATRGKGRPSHPAARHAARAHEAGWGSGSRPGSPTAGRTRPRG